MAATRLADGVVLVVDVVEGVSVDSVVESRDEGH